jgi:hypothetical protein
LRLHPLLVWLCTSRRRTFPHPPYCCRAATTYASHLLALPPPADTDAAAAASKEARQLVVDIQRRVTEVRRSNKRLAKELSAWVSAAMDASGQGGLDQVASPPSPPPSPPSPKGSQAKQPLTQAVSQASANQPAADAAPAPLLGMRGLLLFVVAIPLLAVAMLVLGVLTKPQ